MIRYAVAGQRTSETPFPFPFPLLTAPGDEERNWELN